MSMDWTTSDTLSRHNVFIQMINHFNWRVFHSICWIEQGILVIEIFFKLFKQQQTQQQFLWAIWIEYKLKCQVPKPYENKIMELKWFGIEENQAKFK